MYMKKQNMSGKMKVKQAIYNEAVDYYRQRPDEYCEDTIFTKPTKELEHRLSVAEGFSGVDFVFPIQLGERIDEIAENAYNEYLVRIADYMSDILEALQTIKVKVGNQNINYIPVAVASVNSDDSNRKNKSTSDNASVSGGDTYNFYSQAKLSEVECAREMKKMKQKIAEGF